MGSFSQNIATKRFAFLANSYVMLFTKACIKPKVHDSGLDTRSDGVMAGRMSTLWPKCTCNVANIFV